MQLAEKPYMIGVTAFAKAAEDFPKWKIELSEKSYRTTLMHLPEYWGRVPKLPNRFFGADKNTKDIPYMANMDRLANCMIEIGQRSKNDTYMKAGKLFAKSGELFQSITDNIVEYVCDGKEVLDEVPEMMLQIGKLYEKAYRMFE